MVENTVAGDVTTDTRDWSDSRKRPQVKKCKQPLEAKRGREVESLLQSPEGTQPH